MRWQLKSESDASMPLPRDVLNNFFKTTFSLRDIVNICQIRNLLFLPNENILRLKTLHLCKMFISREASLTNDSIGKVLSEDFLVIPGYDDLMSLKW